MGFVFVSQEKEGSTSDGCSGLGSRCDALPSAAAPSLCSRRALCNGIGGAAPAGCTARRQRSRGSKSLSAVSPGGGSGNGIPGGSGSGGGSCEWVIRPCVSACGLVRHKPSRSISHEYDPSVSSCSHRSWASTGPEVDATARFKSRVANMSHSRRSSFAALFESRASSQTLLRSSAADIRECLSSSAMRRSASSGFFAKRFTPLRD